MNIKPVAILGGGAGAQMMAVDLTARGYSVHLFEHPKYEAVFRPTLEQGAIEAIGIGPLGKFRISRISTDMAHTLEGAEWINVVMPANGHDLFFQELIPSLRKGHKVVVWAGDFGSLRLRYLLSNAGQLDGISIVETSTLPYGTRLVGPAKVCLLVVAPKVLASALPNTSNSEIIPELQKLFPCIVPAKHALAAAFNNPNPIVHPPGSLLNTGRIEFSGGEFYMYHEGITESVALVIREIYEESRRVAEALGFAMVKYRDVDFRTKCSIMGVEFVAPFDPCGVIGSILGPTSVQSRYITEDLPFGLVPRAELGRVVGVPTPVIDGIVSVGSVVCREDYWGRGRTLASLGLSGLGADEIRKLLEG